MHDATRDVLAVLKDLGGWAINQDLFERTVLHRVYNLEWWPETKGPPLDVAVTAWLSAGCPDALTPLEVLAASPQTKLEELVTSPHWRWLEGAAWKALVTEGRFTGSKYPPKFAIPIVTDPATQGVLEFLAAKVRGVSRIPGQDETQDERTSRLIEIIINGG